VNDDYGGDKNDVNGNACEIVMDVGFPLVDFKHTVQKMAQHYVTVDDIYVGLSVSVY
jgi:hypothetical protein